ncbi:MAG: DUF927 domain-containing protein [Zoogloeaceae bacterium]|jgi:hypothetical protein|nr:DUF927 domain-containing protein [Zoogloeaceae bacterium]
MDASAFFRATLPASGFFCLVRLPTPAEKESARAASVRPPPARHLWFADHAALDAAAGTLSSESNWYHATAAFVEAGSAYGGRTRGNVRARRCFHLDIDCGEGKPYAAREDAERALAGFVRAARLPRPSIKVSSGRGLHVYWCLTHDITPEDWTPHARALAVLSATHGFDHDDACTGDATRLLRPPGALHWNGAAVRAVDFGGRYALTELWPPIEGDARAVSVGATASSALPVMAPEFSLGAPRPVADVSADVSCGFILPASVGEGSRNNTLFAYGRSLWGGADARWHDPDALRDALLAANAERFTPPLPVEEVAALAASVVSVAPGLSPEFTLAASEVAPASVIEADPLPEDFPDLASLHALGKYSVGVIAGRPSLWVTPPGEKGDEDAPRARPLLLGLFYLREWVSAGLDSSAAPSLLIVRYRAAANDWRDATLDATALADAATLVKFLATLGLHYTGARVAATVFLRDYVMALEALIRKRAEPLTARDCFGFQYAQDGKPIFAHGALAVDAAGRLRPLAPVAYTRAAASALSVPAVQGTPLGADGHYPDSAWRRLAKSLLPVADVLKRLYPSEENAPLQFALLSAVASQNMLFMNDAPANDAARTLPGGGALIALCSPSSGTGKTVAAMLGLQLASDVSTMVSGALGTTGGSVVAMTARMALYNSLPQVLDEQTGADPEALATLAYLAVNGVNKPRATQEGRVAMNTTMRWALTTILTSNTSIRDAVTKVNGGRTAEQLRILEFDVPVLPSQPDVALVQEATAVVQKAAGATTLLMARWALTHWDAVFPLATSIRARVMQKFALRGDERYLGAALASILFTQVVLARAVEQETGVKDFALVPAERITAVFRETLERCRAHIEETNRTPAQCLAKYIADTSATILRTDTWGDLRAQGGVANIALNHAARYPLTGRYVHDVRQIAFTAQSFMTWCVENSAHRRSVLQEMQALHVIAPDRVVLEKGVRGADATQIRGYTLDCARLEHVLTAEDGRRRRVELVENNVVAFPGATKNANEGGTDGEKTGD